MLPASQSKLKLYGYWRSSASWRIRWALELKKLAYDYVPVNLLSGEQKKPEFLKINPAGRVPALEINDKTILLQSTSILEWLEESYRQQGLPLLPSDPLERAHVRTLAQIINADTAPLQIPLVQNAHSSDPEEKKRWAQSFIRRGLKDFSEYGQNLHGSHSFRNSVSMADLFLVPQVYNAKRYEIDTAKEFPALEKIYLNCMQEVECQKASPERQSDAPSPAH